MDNNILIEREKKWIDDICNKYNYDSNIHHILWILIPAFIKKYGLEKEQLIKNTFENIKIISSNKESETVRAYYSSTLIKQGENYITKKIMVINNYNKISLVELVDSLAHEFNHAINSYKNEIKIGNKIIYLRTGLAFRIYEKSSLHFIKKDPSYILEEIINTKQTEDVMNIIKQMNVEDSNIKNTIYAINSETSNIYNSNSYYLQSRICREIIENRTFFSTLEKLRLTGDVYDIDNWFDNVIGEKKKYQEFIHLLNDIFELEKEYHEKRFFKNRVLNKIRRKSEDLVRIINIFNKNVNFR